jgi:hypothetical protein
MTPKRKRLTVGTVLGLTVAGGALAAAIAVPAAHVPHGQKLPTSSAASFHGSKLAAVADSDSGPGTMFHG